MTVDQLKQKAVGGVDQLAGLFRGLTLGGMEETLKKFREECREHQKMMDEMSDVVDEYFSLDEAKQEERALEFKSRLLKNKTMLSCHIEMLEAFESALKFWIDNSFCRYGNHYAELDNVKARIKTLNRVMKLLGDGKSVEQIEWIMSKFVGGKHRWKYLLGKDGMEAMAVFYEDSLDTGRQRALSLLGEIKQSLEATTLGGLEVKPVPVREELLAKTKEELERVIIMRAEVKEILREENERLELLKKVNL